MKKLLAGCLIVVVLLMAAVYFLFPAPLFKLATNAERQSVGLQKKEIQVDDHRIVYLEGGKGETVLLLHGFGASKDNWTRFAKYLTRDYHVLIPDLAGFGESSKLAEGDYGISTQVKRLDRFAEAMTLTRFHLAGNSMGGMIGAVYSARHPSKVSTLALLAPLGLRSAQKSEFDRRLARGENPLLIKSPDDFDRMMALVFVKPPYIPAPFRKVLAEQAMAGRAFNEKVIQDLVRERLSLEPFLASIPASVLIIWGDTDQILDVSGVSVLEANLKHSRTAIMKQTGHIPMLEKPEETAGEYLRFLKDNPFK